MPGPDRAALLLIDLQEAYFEAPELAARRQDLVRATTALVEHARSVGALVVNVRTEHARDGSTWTLNMVEDGQGFAFSGTEQARTLVELRQVLSGPDVVEIVKTRDNSFLGTRLAEVMDAHDVHDLVVGGVSTHTCVGTTVEHAYALDHRCHLVTDAIASDRPDLHAATIHQLADEFRLAVVSSGELRAQTWTPPVPAAPDSDHRSPSATPPRHQA